LAALALFLGACAGGGDGSPDTTTSDAGAPDAPAGGGGEASDQPQDSADDASGRDRLATISVDGETLTYDLDDIVFSNVEGIDDITFETCSPNFFGSGRFYAIGYAVDEAGEVAVGSDGQPLGVFNMDLPPEDWQNTDRDPPEFEIDVDGADIRIATPEEAAELDPSVESAWTIDDTRATGTALFTDFETSYVVEFDVVCEGEPTVAVDTPPPSDDGGDNDGGGVLAGGGVGSFSVDGEGFDDVAVYSCEPFSFGSDEADPEDLSLLGYLGGSSGLQIEITHSQGIDVSNGESFDQIGFSAFHSRQGSSGLEQFEAHASNDSTGAWFLQGEDGAPVELPAPPFVIQGDRIAGELDGLVQTWPDEGAATVDVTFDFEIPVEVNDSC
jgi:hypothetical protein